MQRLERVDVARAMKRAEEYSSSEAMKHLAEITKLGERHSGHPPEDRMVDYYEGVLKGYGLEVQRHPFRGYFSSGTTDSVLKVVSPSQRELRSVAYAFSASTPPEGIEAAVVFANLGFPQDYQGLDVRGKWVLLEVGDHRVISVPEKERYAQAAGAAGAILTGGLDRDLLVIATTAHHYGNPEPRNLENETRIPVLYTPTPGGLWLKEACQQGEVRVRAQSTVVKAWRNANVLTAQVTGSKEPEKVVIIGSHLDGWFEGAMDPGSANVYNLELARVLARHRGELGRTVRICFWPGHSTGAYAGSSWYIDQNWDDLRKNAIAYFFNDQMGAYTATAYTSFDAAIEGRKFHEFYVERGAPGEKVNWRRMGKSGDTSSFWGIGVPSFTDRRTTEGEARKGGIIEYGWWWHTEADTIDKVDMEVVRPQFGAQMVALEALCNLPVLPYEFVSVAAETEGALRDYAGAAPALGIEGLLPTVRGLRESAEKLEAVAEKLGQDGDGEACGLVNGTMQRLSRILLPIGFSLVGPYGQDPYGTWFLKKHIPVLRESELVKELDPDEGGTLALMTKLRRERNKVHDTLLLARETAETTLRLV